MDLALELALADPRGLADALGDVAQELASLAEALRRPDKPSILAFFKRAAAARKSLVKD